MAASRRRRPVVDARGRKVGAFAKTNGNGTVYLIEHGDLLRHAVKGPGIFDFAVAAIIWHEMAHLEGADETDAQCREETLWQEYVLERRVDGAVGLQYLALLRKRHAREC
jgi:hypothetical protein